MDYFFKDINFLERFDDDDVEKPKDELDSHTLHDDFDEIDEMMMGHGQKKTPTFRQ